MRISLQIVIFTLLFYRVSDTLAQTYLLKAEQVFDGQAMHTGWVVEVTDQRITYVGKERGGDFSEVISLPGHTLMPGLIEGRGHHHARPGL